MGVAMPALSNRTLLEGDAFDVPGTQRSVVYERFAPTVDKQTGVPTADPRVNDPAVVVGVTDAGSPVGEALVPMGSWMDLGAAGASFHKSTCSTAAFSIATIPALRSSASVLSCCSRDW